MSQIKVADEKRANEVIILRNLFRNYTLHRDAVKVGMIMQSRAQRNAWAQVRKHHGA